MKNHLGIFENSSRKHKRMLFKSRIDIIIQATRTTQELATMKSANHSKNVHQHHIEILLLQLQVVYPLH